MGGQVNVRKTLLLYYISVKRFPNALDLFSYLKSEYSMYIISEYLASNTVTLIVKMIFINAAQ